MTKETGLVNQIPDFVGKRLMWSAGVLRMRRLASVVESEEGHK